MIIIIAPLGDKKKGGLPGSSSEKNKKFLFKILLLHDGSRFVLESLASSCNLAERESAGWTSGGFCTTRGAENAPPVLRRLGSGSKNLSTATCVFRF